jgi:ABC-2 type transport system ATP-binding protein
MVDAAPAAAARAVEKSYGRRGAGVRPGQISPALAGVDLDLPRGTVTALLGPNGAGKTTLLRLLAGLLVADGGEVEVLGVRQPAAARPRTVRALRRRIGYVSQDPALDPEMTGREILALMAALHGVCLGKEKEGRGERIARLAEAFGLGAHLDRPVAAWSGGLRRRLHLAAGMIHDPELLLLDEPTAGLDPEADEALWAELVRRAGEGVAVAVATHDLAAAERHAGWVALLDGGRLIAEGNPGELMVRHGCASLGELYRRLLGRDPEGPRTGRGGGRR